MNIDQSPSISLKFPSVDHRLLTACHRLLNIGQLLSVSQFQSVVSLSVSHRLLGINQPLATGHRLLSVYQLLSVNRRLLGISQLLTARHRLLSVDQLLRICHGLLYVG
jgi:hypothetical protein